MVKIDRTFYDKTCQIYKIEKTDKDWTQVPVTTILFSDLPCDYYIAPRWNVTNFLSWPEARNTERDRFDCVIPWKYFDKDQPILKWYWVILSQTGFEEWNYKIDQVNIYRKPNWIVENIYLRLNNNS